MKVKADAILTSGISTWMAIDYVFPWFNGFVWGVSPAMISAFREDLNGTDEGLILSSNCKPIHFSDYFNVYNGFAPSPSDLGLSDWSVYLPPGVGASAVQKFIFGYLRSYEWLKYPDRVGRYMQAKGGKGTWIEPNIEDSVGSPDYVFALRSQGVAGLAAEYFQNAALSSEAAYASLGYLHDESVHAGKSLILAFESGAGGNSAPYQDWRVALATAYTLTAAGQANNVENDWLSSTYAQGSVASPSNRRFANFRDAIAKGTGFRLARQDHAVRPTSRFLVVAERPPAGVAHSIFFTTQQTHSFAPAFSRAGVTYDLRDELNLDQTISNYQFLALSPFAIRVGDDQTILRWLKGRSGRVLLTHTFVPTRSTVEYWTSVGLTTGAGRFQFGNSWGIGDIRENPEKSATITFVDPMLSSIAANVGLKLFFASPRTSFRGSTVPTKVLVDSDAGPLVTLFQVDSSYVIYLGFSPFAVDVYERNPNADSNLSFTTALIKALSSTFGSPIATPWAESDSALMTQTYDISGGRSVVVWDRAAAEAWRGPSSGPYPYTAPAASHVIKLPVSGSTSYFVYDFLADKLMTIAPHNDRIAFHIRSRSTGIFYVGSTSDPDFAEVLTRVRIARAKFDSLGFAFVP